MKTPLFASSPTTVHAAHNALRAEREIFNDMPSSHTNSPAAGKAMREAALKHFAKMRETGGAR